MITIANEKTVITCNTCKKSKITVDGARARRQGYTKAIELGWRWKNAETQICPSCRKLEAKANGTEKASKPAAKPVKKSDKKVTLFGRKTNKAAKPAATTPFTAGQSTGKLAKSAKVSAAPAAE